jgi:succinate dehydrogenase / fumarate reductase flavoprotein subunit
MLISEAARGEGGRLYYIENGRRVYFMEERFGERGNLMPRDIVSKCIYDAPSRVYLDVAFLGERFIRSRLLEVAEVCSKYAGIDVTKESIPVYPSVHFFMGGIAVDGEHKTSIERLYAIGECASRYHGANRLGGNSLLAAVYGGKVAAKAIGELPMSGELPDFCTYIADQSEILS